MDGRTPESQSGTTSGGRVSADRPAVLVVRAPDRPGLVAAVAAALRDSGATIVDADSHTDRASGIFLQRIALTGAGGTDLDTAALLPRLLTAQGAFGLTFELHRPTGPARLVIACSRHLHCASDLLARCALGELDATVVAVVSDKEDGRELAERHGVPFEHLPVGDDRGAQERRLGERIDALDPDLVVLARYMRVLPGWLTDRWFGRMINIHHSFLPAFIGADPYRKAHERGVKLIGATAHYVTEELDAGPIIDQDVVRVSHRDSVADLVRKGRDVERLVLADAVRWHLDHRVVVFGNRTCVFA
jgi:formyltetrahydrofolate deformylase